MRHQLLELLHRRNLLRLLAQPARLAVLGEHPSSGPAAPALTPSPLPDDHLDLLVTAAARWDALAGAAAHDAMTALLQARADAVQAGTGGAWPPPVSGADESEHHQPVRESLKPVEVLKAARAFERVSRSAPGWRHSAARELTARVARAAEERLDGYAAAPRVWTRPQERRAPAFGLSSGWHPETLGLEWVAASEYTTSAAARWEQATRIVVTTAALAFLPPEIPHRPSVYVIAQEAPDDATWTRIVSLRPEAVLFWPVGTEWLQEQLRQPVPGPARFRPQR